MVDRSPLASMPASHQQNNQRTSALEQPRILGRYRILEEVGRGATALVYKAYDPQLDRFLAIKVLRDRLAKDDDYREGFVREARLAAQLTHSNIVTIYDVGISNHKPYIAMELLEGATLEKILQRNSKLPLKTILAISSQLAAALAYAHKTGVVHRDIKPGNIILLKDRKTVKLTDFGIAQIDENLSKKGRASDKVLGTPEYMSPEQILGQVIDSRSDLYSTGVLMYKMLTGLPPFISDDLGVLFKQIIQSKQPEMSIDNEHVDDDLKDLVRKLLQKKPEKRFQSASQLLIELRHITSKIAKPAAQKKAVFSSLTTRWTIIMASSVFASMCIGLVVVYFMQYRALSGITYDYGNTIGKMIAYQSSESIVLGDSIALNALAKENVKNQQLEAIYVMDNKGVILASNLKFKRGQKFTYQSQDDAVKILDKTKFYKREMADGHIVFDVSLPVYFADKKVGRLFVSFSADSMYQASNTTLITMLVVMLVTLLVVSIATIILAKQTSKDYKRVATGLKKMALGRVDARILTERNDEASQLFSAFNQLAGYLERLLDKRSEMVNGKRRNNDTQEINVTQTSLVADEQSEADTVELKIEPIASDSKVD